jgi:resuscitation-promoting factor RpfB
LPAKGVYLAIAGGGAILLWSGLRGKSWSTVLRDIVSGKNPKTAPTSNPIQQASPSTTTPASSSPSGGSSTTYNSNAPTGGIFGTVTAGITQALAQNIARAMGHADWTTGQEWQDWVYLWDQESSWNNNALNSSSGAYGIAQALGHGTPATAGASNNEYGGYGLTTKQAIAANNGSPTYQIIWGINYIATTYGSPSAAWAHEEANNWY